MTIYSAPAPDEHGDGSIFSSVQKVPIYLGAPILSSPPGLGRVLCEWLQERACASLSICRLVPEEAKTKTVQEIRTDSIEVL